jgi:hypothetical protein
MATEMVGRTFGRWTVVSFAFAKPPHKYWNCRCECGTERPVQGPSLIRGTSVSCGCTKGAAISAAKTKHGQCAHPAYQSWSAMRRRCYDPSFAAYPWYGACGIKICDKWQTFEGFWEDMGSTWARGLTIERNKNEEGYTVQNCRWATRLEQGQNKSNSHLLETPWGRLSQNEAARRAGISIGSLVHRQKAGWPPETWFLPSSRKPPD